MSSKSFTNSWSGICDAETHEVQLLFQITQDERDELLMESLVTYFGCGRVVKNVEHNGSKVYFYVTKFKDIQDKIIPFFRQYKILGEKWYDF